MSTKFVVALITVVLVALVVVPAVAEETCCIAAVVVSYKASSFEDLEVEVIDAEGEMWTYYADEAHVGDLVILTVFDFGAPGFEDDEIVDVANVGRLDDVEMFQWLSR